ncbi:hypothetical protein [Robinsoniella peoriensis]
MKNTRQLNVIMLHLGEAMYPQDYLEDVIKKVQEAVSDMECNLVGCYKVMSEKDAGECSRLIEGSPVDLFILNFVSWHITPYVMHILKNYTHIPLLIWGIGGTTDKTGKLHSPAAAAGITGFLPVAKEFGFTVKVILQKPDSAFALEEAAHFIRLAACAKKVRESRIGLIGYADMGLYTCAYDKTALFKKLGIDIEDYSGYEIMNRMAQCTSEQAAEIVTDIRSSLKFENQISDQVLEKAARLYYAMKSKADGSELDAISIKCVNGTTDHLGLNPCLAQSLLAGKDLSVICECDAYGLVTSILLSSVTGHAAAFMEHYEVFEKEVLVGVCGFIPEEFTENGVKIRAANLGEINTGISNVSKVRTGEVTFARFYQTRGEFKLFLSKGTAKAAPKWTELGWEEPTPDFPAVLLTLTMPIEEYLDKVPGQHIIMVYGDWIEDVKTVCRLLDIEVVE